MLMKFLTVVGTAAMFMVGGGILTHGISVLHHAIDAAASVVATWSFGGLLEFLVPLLLNTLAGVVAGLICWALVTSVSKLRAKIR